MKRFLCLALCFAVPSFAQDEKTKEPAKPAQKVEKKKQVPKNRRAFLAPKTAGPDFEIQGEYVGKVHDGELKLGLQVIALGDGKFDAWAYPGGLPGAGWTQEQRVKASGETRDGVTPLKSEMGTAEIKDGMAIAYNNDGEKMGELRKVVRKSPTLGKKPTKDAMVLFDGKSTDKWNWKDRSKKKLDKGLLVQGVWSKAKFGSFRLHMEFMLSFMPYAGSQGRSNSGCYMQGRYETQILDSFGLEGKHNECGGIYTVAKPKVNMCLPPLSWQTYDVEFHEAEFDPSGKKVKNARMTVRHNDVLVHDDVEISHATTASRLKEGPEPGPIYIQDHSNPVRFRNIWIEPVEKKIVR